MLYDRLILRTSSRWMTVEPFEPALPHDKVLFFDRRVATAKPYVVRNREDCAPLAEPDTERVIYGLVGVVDLLVDTYLIVIDSRVAVGTIFERTVYRVTKLTAIPVRGVKALKAAVPNIILSRDAIAQEQALFAMLRDAVALPGYYFAHGYDLTRSTQTRMEMHNARPDLVAEADISRADLRFVWNRYAAKPLVDAGILSWIVPLILGYVDIRENIVNGKHVRLALISRRSADRPGLRFTARGADIHGNVSNFVETEQIVMHGASFASFIQIRGSIPLLWQQEACIKYKPPVKLKAVDAGGKDGLSQAAFEKHYAALFDTYGPVTAVSLIDSRGHEAILSSALLSAVENMNSSKLHFVPWDFHQKTKTLGYSNIDKELLSLLNTDLESYRYLLVNKDDPFTPAMRQRGIVRTNCVDSLDRTNVVQSVIAHRVMDDALKHMGVLNDAAESCTAASFKDFEMAFKTTWADHADAIAIVYAGSGAMKTDYTRTGKRTKAGMLKDGYRAAKRYVYQNFLDGRRQDGIDLFLGVVSLDKSTALTERGLVKLPFSDVESLPMKERMMPYVLLSLLTLGTMGSLVVRRTWQKLFVVCFSFGGAAVVLKMITKNGRKYVARPRMNGTN